MSDHEWAHALGAANPSDLLPKRFGAISYVITGPLRIVDFLPLGKNFRLCIISDAAQNLFSIPLVLANGVARRATPGDGTAQHIIEYPVGINQLGNFTITVRESAPAQSERSISVDQTEESVVVGEVAVVKYFSQVVESSLTSLPKIQSLSKADYHFMPRSLLSLEWKNSTKMYLLAEATQFIPDAIDGWTWAVEDAQNFIDVKSSLDEATQSGVVLGQLLAQMHQAFIATGSSQSSAADVSQWLDRAERDLSLALEVGIGPEGEVFRNWAPEIAKRFNAHDHQFSQVLSFTHGDLHVGQILRTPNNKYFVIDFDGNPVADSTSTPNNTPLLQDLASLIQSIDHVARVVNRRRNLSRTEELQEWSAHTQNLILKTYEDLLGIRVDLKLLKIFQIQQECREFIYAQKHLPVWRYVPEAALVALMKEN